jgi:hypothetical protein
MRKSTSTLGAIAFLLVGFAAGLGTSRGVGASFLSAGPVASPKATGGVTTVVDQRPCKPPKVVYVYINADSQEYLYCIDPTNFDALDDCMDHSASYTPLECLVKYSKSA